MGKNRPAIPNAERQRKFRKGHPGYYARIQARKRASGKRAVEQFRAAAQAEHQAAIEAERQAIAAMLTPKPEPLMLPAPVEVLIFPGLKTIETLSVSVRK